MRVTYSTQTVTATDGTKSETMKYKQDETSGVDPIIDVALSPFTGFTDNNKLYSSGYLTGSFAFGAVAGMFAGTKFPSINPFL